MSHDYYPTTEVKGLSCSKSWSKMSDVSDSEASKEAMSIHEAVNHVFSKSWHLRSHPYIEYYHTLRY